MIQVGLLTETQKNEIEGQMFDLDSYFYPFQDIDDNWIISIEEMEKCVNPAFDWVKDLTLIEHKPKPVPLLF
jgi:hypothetical protein